MFSNKLKLPLLLLFLIFVGLFSVGIIFAVSDSANVNLQVTSEGVCNNNGVCESNLGENSSNCPSDCGGGPGDSHTECNAQQQCISVAGSGIDQCSSGNDCATHNECNAQNQCVSTSGVGSNQCQTDSNCVTTHTECNLQNQCVAVSGVGINQCQADGDCQPTKHNECNSQGQCIVVDGAGNDQCLTDSDCYIAHNECNLQNQCVAVSGVGINQCQADGDCQPTKHNECNSQNQCVVVDGAGNDQCLTNGDCIGAPPGPEPIVTSHTECNAQNQCISTSGVGSDQCQSSSDCAGIIENIITEPSKTIEKITNEVAKQIKKIIESPQGSAVAKTISTTGSVVAIVATASGLLSLSFFDIFLVILRLFGLLLTAIGLKKKVLPWGVVYDSVTKQPIDPAYVTLKNLKGENIASAITDLDGRYGFLVDPGVYQMSVKKTNYNFPSQKLVGRTHDELYENLYFGGNIEIKTAGEVIIKNIPLDSVKFNWNEFAKKSKNLMRFYSKWDVAIRRIYDLIFAIGFAVAVIAYIFAPYPYNTAIMILYLILLLLRVFGLKPKTYGYVIDKKTGIPLSFAILRIIRPGFENKITPKSIIADRYGKYYCLVAPGKYYMQIERKNNDESYSLAYTSQVIDVSKKGIINERFKV